MKVSDFLKNKKAPVYVEEKRYQVRESTYNKVDDIFDAQSIKYFDTLEEAKEVYENTKISSEIEKFLVDGDTGENLLSSIDI